MFEISGGIFLGWALGSNDAANVFGTAVASGIVRYRRAVILAAIFIIIGALAEGSNGVQGVSELSSQTPRSAFVVSIAAALTVTIMTTFRLPVSATQAVIGAIVGMGFFVDPAKIEWYKLWRMVLCWLGTPIGAAALAFIFYPILSLLLDKLQLNLLARSIFLKIALLISGCYGAYALGANNLGNVTGVYYQTGIIDNVHILMLIGGAAIALGVLTYSRNVMFTVGSRLVQLDAFSALVAVMAMAVTVHFYAQIGVPVSTSQAIVGAVLGIGLFKGVKTINRRIVVSIFFGWLCTPLIAGLVCWTAARIFL